MCAGQGLVSFVRNVGMSACVFVSAPEAINYIHTVQQECLAGIKFGESLHQKWLVKKFGKCLQQHCVAYYEMD